MKFRNPETSDKGIEDWTLAEAKAECSSRNGFCGDCPLGGTICECTPEEWEFTKPSRWTELDHAEAKAECNSRNDFCGDCPLSGTICECQWNGNSPTRRAGRNLIMRMQCRGK